MLKIRANLRLYKDGRKTPIVSQYRPLLNFSGEFKTGIEIALIDRDLMYPGDVAIIEFKFLFPELVADQYTIGTMFLLFEGPKPIGEGEILGCYK